MWQYDTHDHRIVYILYDQSDIYLKPICNKASMFNLIKMCCGKFH